MIYTLAKFFLWGLGFAVIGGVIGWLLRSVRCASELQAARRTTVDNDEVERLRHRVANLEPLIADRDALRARIADLELEAKSGTLVPASVAGFASLDGASVDGASVDGASVDGASVDGASADGDGDVPEVAAAPAIAAFAGFAVDHDLDAARAAFGSKVDLDDLKIVEGIGPVLEQVLHGAGITTWSRLGATAPETIKGILVGADDRHRMHDPTSWPRQARLAAIGEWDALKSLQDRLTAGRH